MLVLTRKINERIMIGDDIEVVLVDIMGDQVKIGIEAPNHLNILRSEIYTNIKKENVAAAKSLAPNSETLGKLIKKKD